MPGNQAASVFPLVSREQAGNAIGKALRLYVGRGRQYTVKELSNGTRVKDRVIECAMIDAANYDYRPLPHDALFSIGLFLGAEFTQYFMALMRQGSFDLPDEGEPDPGAVAIDASEDSTKITRAAIDGHFDKDEARDLRVVGQREIKRGMALVALSSKAA